MLLKVTQGTQSQKKFLRDRKNLHQSLSIPKLKNPGSYHWMSCQMIYFRILPKKIDSETEGANNTDPESTKGNFRMHLSSLVIVVIIK